MAIIDNPSITISGGGWGGVVNGTIKSYLASTNTVNADTFVEFITNINASISAGAETELSGTAYSGSIAISAVKADENRVFIAHNVGNGDAYLYGVVVDLSGGGITVGADTLISSQTGSGGSISAVLLEKDKVFIAHSYSSSQLYGIVVSINGTVITYGTDTKISNSSNVAANISAVKIDAGKVFVAHSYGSNFYLFGLVATINGTSITYGSDEQLGTSANMARAISSVAICPDHVFVAHTSGGTSALYGMVVNINNGTTPSKGSDTMLSNATNSSKSISAVGLDNGSIVVMHSYGSDVNLYGIALTVDGTTLTVGSDTLLSSVANAGEKISACAIDGDSVFISHSYGSTDRYLYGMLVSVSGTTITHGQDYAIDDTTILTAYRLSSVMMGSSVFMAHSYDSDYHYLYGIEVDGFAEVKESENKIDGLTKTECTTSTAGDVYVL